MDFLPLPRGITGFRHMSEAPLPVVELSDARRVIAAMLAHTGAIAFEPDPPGSVASFHDIGVRQRTRTLRLLVHQTYPWIVLAEPADGSSLALRFVAPPHDAHAPSPPFAMVPLEVLARPVDEAALSLLAPTERKQIAYWRPRTVGEVVFQYWD